MNKLITFFGIFLCLSTAVQAQSNAWTRQRYNIYGGLGMINFLGDLGGGRGDAHWFKDLNLSTTRPSLTAGGRYKILEEVAIGTSMSFGWYAGNDELSKNLKRRERNLHFRSVLFEWSAYGEYHIIKEKLGKRTTQLNRRTNLLSWQSIQALPINVYVFAGVAGFFFNPKAKYLDGKWYALQPLGTEGQNILPSRKKYSRIQMSFPFGLGVRHAIDRRFSIGLEYGVRYTTTDYMDDVSTNYIHPDLLPDPKAKYFADPNTSGKKYGANNRRGSPLNNDYYMFTVVSLSYKMRTGPNGLPKF